MPRTTSLTEADGFVFGSPVYYAHPTGQFQALLDRMFYAGIEHFLFKPGAAVVTARRAGTTASLDVLNKYFTDACMPVVSSTYWNMAHGNTPEQLEQDLEGLPLIMSRQALVQEDISRWGKKQIQNLNVVATYNLVYNAAIMTREGFGYTLTLDKLANTGSDSDLCFRPLKPELRINLNLVWKKYQIFSKASQKFLEYLKNEINA